MANPGRSSDSSFCILKGPIEGPHSASFARKRLPLWVRAALQTLVSKACDHRSHPQQSRSGCLVGLEKVAADEFAYKVGDAANQPGQCRLETKIVEDLWAQQWRHLVGALERGADQIQQPRAIFGELGWRSIPAAGAAGA